MSPSSVLSRLSLWQRRTAGAQPRGQVAIATGVGQACRGWVEELTFEAVTLDPLPIYDNNLKDKIQYLQRVHSENMKGCRLALGNFSTCLVFSGDLFKKIVKHFESLKTNT